MKVTVNLNNLSCKDALFSMMKEHVENTKKELGEERFHQRVNRGMITTKPRVDFNFTKVPNIDNCGAVLVTSGSIAFCHRPVSGSAPPNSTGSLGHRFAALPVEVHREIAKEITRELFSVCESSRSLIVATDSIEYNKDEKRHVLFNFPKKFVYLAAFNPEQWSISSASAVGNPSHHNRTTIFTLSCRRFVKHNLRTDTIKRDCRNNEYFKNIRFD